MGLSFRLVPHSVHVSCPTYPASVGILGLPLLSLKPTQPLLYSLESCELTKGWPSHEVFRDWRKGTCGPLTTSLVRWLEVLDTFQSQRPKTFANCITLITYRCIIIAIYGRMKDVLREKFRSFGEQNASHLSVNPPVHGHSGLRWVWTRGNPSDWYPALQHPAGCLKPSPVPFPIGVSTSTPTLHEIEVTSSPQHLPSGYQS